MDVEMFDLVPWSHGYAHSWALRWMLLNHREARDRLMGLLVPSGRAPWRVDAVAREYRVGRHRADLGFEAIDADGQRTEVLVETKVNDGLNPAQLSAYSGTGAEVVVYGPGLTGLLHTGTDPIGQERWLSGREILNALVSLVGLPELITSYLGGVRMQADRMDAARRAARGGSDFDRTPDFSDVSDVEVESVAWIAEIASDMRDAGAREVVPRNTAYDWGIYWGGAWTPTTRSESVGLYIDVIAAHGGSEYAVTIKISGGTVEERLRVFEAARHIDLPPGWTLGRPSKRESFRIWKQNAESMDAGEAAQATLHARELLEGAAQQIRSML